MSTNWTMLLLICCMFFLHNAVSSDIVLLSANNAAETEGGRRFDSVMGIEGALKFMGDAIPIVQTVLDYSKDGVPHKDVTKITFTLDDIQGVAYTRWTWSGTDYGTEYEIHLSASYVGSISGDVVQEIKRLLVHEMTHVWQWYGKENAPGGLIEGIADFVTYKANFARPLSLGEGDKWDQGYEVTACFLVYCDHLMSGFVSELNVKLESGWSESFFNDLLGKSVQDLWNDYKQMSNLYAEENGF